MDGTDHDRESPDFTGGGTSSRNSHHFCPLLLFPGGRVLLTGTPHCILAIAFDERRVENRSAAQDDLANQLIVWIEFVGAKRPRARRLDPEAVGPD